MSADLVFIPPIRFANFELDLRTRELRRSGLRLKLEEKPFQLLLLLVETETTPSTVSSRLTTGFFTVQPSMAANKMPACSSGLARRAPVSRSSVTSAHQQTAPMAVFPTACCWDRTATFTGPHWKADHR